MRKLPLERNSFFLKTVSSCTFIGWGDVSKFNSDFSDTLIKHSLALWWWNSIFSGVCSQTPSGLMFSWNVEGFLRKSNPPEAFSFHLFWFSSQLLFLGSWMIRWQLLRWSWSWSLLCMIQRFQNLMKSSFLLSEVIFYTMEKWRDLRQQVRNSFSKIHVERMRIVWHYSKLDPG